MTKKFKARPNAQRAEVYNEGLAVYLYDPANAKAILDANPTSVLGFGDVEPSKDKALKKVVQQGLLVTYFLRQDDSIVVDVAVGPPLSKAEIKACGVPLMKPSQTVISIPSGRLRIDTANTFRLNDGARGYAEEYEKEHGHPPAEDNLEAFGIEDESGEIEVPVGEYVLTLYRIDFERLGDNEKEEDEEYDGPGEFITLTPAKDIERPKRIPPVIDYGAGYAKIAGLRAWKIDGDKFHGLMVGGGIANFNWSHATKLGLRRGQHLRLRHEDKDYDAVYLGGIEPRSNPDLCSIVYADGLKGLSASHPEWLTAAIHEESILNTPLLWIQTLKPNQTLEAEKASPLTIEPLDDFILPAPDAAAIPQGECVSESIRGKVLAAGDRGVELGCGTAALKAFRASKVAELTLRIGMTTVPLLLLPSAEHRHRPFHIIGSLKRSDEVLFTDVFAYMISGGDEVFCACVGSRRSVELIALLNEYQKGCTFSSSKGYVPKDPARGKELKKQSLALWREGLTRFAGPGAMSAALIRHWDDPNATSLSCRMIAYPGENSFPKTAGADFEITKLD